MPDRTPLATPTQSDSEVIFLVGTMTDPEGRKSVQCSCYGEDAWEGAHLAVNVLNRQSDDRTYELVVLDDHGDTDRAVQLVEEAAASGRAVGIVYAGPPDVLPRVERVLAEATIPLVMVFGDPYTARALTPHVFQAAPPLLWQARSIVRYLVSDRRYRRIGLVSTRSVTGDTAVTALRQALDERGLRLAAGVRWAGAAGAEDLLRRLRSARLEAVVVEGPPDLGSALLAAARRSGAAYRSTARARTVTAPTARLRRAHSKRPRPHLVFLATGFAREVGAAGPPPGTLISETYARGAHYLPIPAFERFRQAFRHWWDDEPLGWELRGYDAARAIGWAAERARGGDVALALEGLRDTRFGGLPITLGPDDHTFVTDTTIGLWVRPRPGARAPELDRLPRDLRFVPLQRGFSIDGEHTIVLPPDWKHLFRGPTRPTGPAPKVTRARFGVATPRRDPIH